MSWKQEYNELSEKYNKLVDKYNKLEMDSLSLVKHEVVNRNCETKIIEADALTYSHESNVLVFRIKGEIVAIFHNPVSFIKYT